MSLTAALLDRARPYNAQQAAAGEFTVRVPPTGGRASLFTSADSVAFAEWVARMQTAGGVRADGALGPTTLRRFRWLVLEALKDGSAAARAAHAGWEIFDRIGFTLEGVVSPMPTSTTSAGAPSYLAPSYPAGLESSGNTWLYILGALLVGGAVIWKVTR